MPHIPAMISLVCRENSVNFGVGKRVLEDHGSSFGGYGDFEDGIHAKGSAAKRFFTCFRDMLIAAVEPAS